MSSQHLSRSVGGSSLPPPPPPPVLRSRSRNPRRDMGRSRSRSRSRSPGHRSRYHHERSRSRRSPSPYSTSRKPPPKQIISQPVVAAPVQQQPQQQSISLVPPQSIPAIIRRIMNPDEVKIPRRPAEGVRPIFDRDELRDSILRRMRSGDNSNNPPASTLPSLPEPVTQRVVAIIREPVLTHEHGAHGYSARLPHVGSQPVASEPLRPSSSGGPSGFRQPSSVSPHARDRRSSRSLERIERDLRERERDREREREIRERAHYHEIHAHPSSSRSSQPENVRGRSRSRSRGSPGLSGRTRNEGRVRRSRSRSVTPPPMPEHVRRQIERDMERDLRNSLSRPPGPGKPYFNKYHGEHDRRDLGTNSSFRGRGSMSRGFRRPGGGRGIGFQIRSRGQGRDVGRSYWEHDLFENEHGEPGDSKSRKD